MGGKPSPRQNERRHQAYPYFRATQGITAPKHPGLREDVTQEEIDDILAMSTGSGNRNKPGLAPCNWLRRPKIPLSERESKGKDYVASSAELVAIEERVRTTDWRKFEVFHTKVGTSKKSSPSSKTATP